MKKELLYIITLAVLAGCVKEASIEEQKKIQNVSNDENVECHEGYVCLELCSSDDGSKLHLNGLKAVWDSGDKIVVNGDVYTVLFKDGQAYVNVKAAQTYEAYYPADIWDSNKLYVQPAQFYSAGSFGQKANPMHASATAESSNLAFTHLMGVLKLTVKGSGTVASVSVTDNDGGSVCGYYSYSFGKLITVSNAVHFPSVTLNCKTKTNGGVDLSASGTDFYIVMPAREYSKGLTINIECVNGHSMTLNSSTPRTIARASILSTPAINFSYDADQIYEYHFDNLVLGSDAVAGKLGFKTANPSSLTGFEYLTSFTSSTSEDGTTDISTSGTNNDFSGLGKTYAYSRNIQNFTKVHRVRESHGCLACGTGHDAKASFKFPALTNMGSGIYKVEYSFKMAFQNGHKPTYGIQILHTTSTPGKMLELWVDGVNVTGTMDNKMRWCSTSDTDGSPKLNDASHTEERLLVCPSDFSNDCQWHDVKVVVGVATSKTVLEFQAFGSAVDQPWFIDDVKAVKVAYPDNLSSVTFRTPSTIQSKTAMGANEALMPSLFINPLSSSARNYLKTYSALYKFTYVDLSISASVLFSSSFYGIASLDDADWVKFDQAVATAKAALDAMGVKVWSIHLPYTNLKEGGVTDENAFEWCCTDETARAAAVNRMKVIMRHLAPFAPKYWMVHTTYHHNWDFEGYTQTWFLAPKLYYKNAGVTSFTELVTYAAALKYSDNSTGSFTIENIANTGDYSGCIAGSLDNLIWFCDQCPGLGICLDTGHGVVNGINASDGDYTDAVKKMCDKDYLKHLHVHGNNVGNNKDVHLVPGYKPGLFQASFSTTDTIDWGKFYAALVDNGYRGAFTYELSSPLYDGDWRDCIASFPNIINNYMEVILKSYKNN